MLAGLGLGLRRQVPVGINELQKFHLLLQNPQRTTIVHHPFFHYRSSSNLSDSLSYHATLSTYQ